MNTDAVADNRHPVGYERYIIFTDKVYIGLFGADFENAGRRI